jgi:hypothetical protein
VSAGIHSVLAKLIEKTTCGFDSHKDFSTNVTNCKGLALSKRRYRFHRKERPVSLETILIIVLVVFLLGGGWYYGRR